MTGVTNPNIERGQTLGTELRTVTPTHLAFLCRGTYDDVILQDLTGMRIILSTGGGFSALGGGIEKTLSNLRRLDVALERGLNNENIPIVTTKKTEHSFVNYIELSAIEDTGSWTSAEPGRIGQDVTLETVKDNHSKLIKLLQATNRLVIFNKLSLLDEGGGDTHDSLEELISDVSKLRNIIQPSLEGTQQVPVIGSIINIKSLI